MNAEERISMAVCAADRLKAGHPIDDDWYRGHGLQPLHIRDLERSRFHVLLGKVLRKTLGSTTMNELVRLDGGAE